MSIHLNSFLPHCKLQLALYSQHFWSALAGFWVILPAHQVIGVFLGGDQNHPAKASPREKEEGPQGGLTAAWQICSDLLLIDKLSVGSIPHVFHVCQNRAPVPTMYPRVLLSPYAALCSYTILQLLYPSDAI